QAYDAASKELWGEEGPLQSVSLLFKEPLSHHYQNRESPLTLRDWSFSVKEGGELYKKNFSVPQHNITFSRDQDDTTGDWMMGVPEHNFREEESTPYMAFGGYWNPKAPLDQCEPLYFSIDTDEENVSTNLYLFRHKEWVDREIFPPKSGKTENMRIVFLGCDEPTTNLSEDVRSGKILVEVTSNPSGETKIYQSRSIVWEDLEQGTAELTLYGLSETQTQTE
ncbi:MAG: hypothetical protein GY915_01720, partial [bacterium]|nr:hypothetical protein [bacterium]